jgi:hypothetical protein
MVVKPANPPYSVWAGPKTQSKQLCSPTASFLAFVYISPHYLLSRVFMFPSCRLQ